MCDTMCNNLIILMKMLLNLNLNKNDYNDINHVFTIIRINKNKIKIR